MPMVKPLTVTTPNDLEVVIVRDFDAPRDLVWRAHTEPALVRRWLSGYAPWELTRCDLDVRAGGAIRYEWTNTKDGARMGLSGTYRAVEPPSRIVHTELFDEDWTGGETVVTTDFAERDRRTTVTMTIAYVSTEARAAALKTGMTDGMEWSYGQLEKVLASIA